MKQHRRLAIIAGLVIAVLALLDFSGSLLSARPACHTIESPRSSVSTSRSLGPERAPRPGRVDQAKYRIGVLDKALGLVDATDGKVLFTLSTFVETTSTWYDDQGPRAGRGWLGHPHGGETSSFDAVEQIKQAFAASPRLAEVSVTETRVGASPNQVVFRISVTVEKP